MSELPLPSDLVWASLTREPSTGVGVVTGDGTVVYLNDQAARIFHGPEASASEYLGRRWRDYMPEDWVNERLEMLARVKLTGRPLLIRTIWRGVQQFTWVYPIEREGPEPELFLTLTKRAETDGEAEKLASDTDYEWVDSQVANLGPLEVLSRRELEVLALLGDGLSIEATAKVLFRSEETVKSHRRSIASKLHESDRVRLARIAARAGLRVEDAQRERVDAPRSELPS